ncbi:MAG: hypothetical protein AVO35_01725 [Candidatus Aegiribacteria sp. MLS_C]|nr:MAG: hypothetical protein AVO35_01725 [Candidatus Aegiribacteria sp. MLS_C]
MLETLFWTFFLLFLSSWLVYPLLLALMSLVLRRHDGCWKDPDPWPQVSVMISARNEGDVIGARIENLLGQDYSGELQVLVGSDASEDRTEDVAGSFSDRGVVLYASRERLGKPRMVQRLLELATGTVLVFTDADTVFAPDTVSRLVRPYSDPSVGCVDGNRRNSLAGETCESIYWRYEKAVKTFCSRMGAVLGATGAVFSVRRDLFRPLSSGRADDFEIAVMARLQGFHCVFDPGAVAAEPSPDDSRQYRRMVRIVSWMVVSCLMLMGRALARGRIFLFLQLLVHKMLRWLSGVFLVLATVMAGLLVPETFYTVIFMLLCIFHAAAAAGMLLRGGIPSKLNGGFPSKLNGGIPSKLLFPYYFWLMNVAAADGILRTLCGRPVETWEKRKGGSD